MKNRGGPAVRHDPLTINVMAGTPLVRIHQVAKGPIWFGPEPGLPPVYRFDAPNGEYRTLYCAANLEGAFAETIVRRAQRIISRSYVNDRQWSVFSFERDMKIVKLYDNGLVWHDQTADICAGDDYSPSQTLAREFYHLHPDVDGIAYRARHNNGEICYAIFDRLISSDIKILETRSFANEIAKADGLLRLHGASWDPMTPLPPSPP